MVNECLTSMATARLIDINTAAIVYRTKCLIALDKHMYRNCVGAINSMNALLPADADDKVYRIIIDSDQYESKINASYIMVCTHCEKEIEYDMIKVMDFLVSSNEWIVTGDKMDKVWFCPKCKEQNKLSITRIIESTLEKPYYYRYVPEPPEYKTGLLSQIEFHNRMSEWVWNCITNIEEGFTRFRDDNWKRGDSIYEDMSIDTSLDEVQV